MVALAKGTSTVSGPARAALTMLEGRTIDVLVVEDQPDLARSTAEVLRTEGFIVATAGTVEEALRLIATRDVRSVILDHQLGGEDGDRFLRDGFDLPPVVAVTGMGPDLLADLRATHGDRLFACLAKPVRPTDLIKVVTAAIGS